MPKQVLNIEPKNSFVDILGDKKHVLLVNDNKIQVDNIESIRLSRCKLKNENNYNPQDISVTVTYKQPLRKRKFIHIYFNDNDIAKKLYNDVLLSM